jgi:hypothetical protein
VLEAASSSEAPVNFYQTSQCNNTEDSHFHYSFPENLKNFCSSFYILIGLHMLNAQYD